MSVSAIQPPSQAHGPATAPWGRHLKDTLAIGMPLAATQLAHMAIGVTDTVMVGWLGAPQLAALTLATQSFFMVLMFGTGFAQAVLPLAAGARGADDVRGVRRSVRMGLWVLGIYGIAALALLSQTERFLLVIGQDAQAAADAQIYMGIAMWALLPALGIMGLRSFLVVIDKAHVVLWATILMAFANAALNWVLIFGHLGFPALGIRGAAVATLGCNLVGFTVLALYSAVQAQARAYELFVRFWRPDWPAFGEVVRLGWPIGATIIAEVALFYASSLMMGWLGVIQLAAHGIALQLASVTFMIPLGLANAATMRVGLALGRGDTVNLARAAATVQVLSAIIASAAALVFWLFPEPLISLFLDESNTNTETVLAAGVPLLAVAAAFQLVDALQAVGAGLLRGLKDTRVPMVIAIVAYWGIGLPAGYLLAFVAGYGGPGIWAGLAFGLAGAAVMMNWRFSRRQALGLVSRQS